MSDSITVFGTGLMGLPIVQTLMRAGWNVRDWNRTPTLARYQQLVNQGYVSLDHSALHALFWLEGAA